MNKYTKLAAMGYHIVYLSWLIRGLWIFRDTHYTAMMAFGGTLAFFSTISLIEAIFKFWHDHHVH